MLVEEIAAWRASRDGAVQVAREFTRPETVQRQTALQIAPPHRFTGRTPVGVQLGAVTGAEE